MRNICHRLLFFVSIFLVFSDITILAATGRTDSGSETAFRVYIIFGIIIFLFGLFSGHDWSMFAFRIANMDNPEIHSRYAKFLVTFLCTVLIWIAGRFALNPEDTRRLAIAYSFIVLGDVIFFFNVHSRIGVLSFATAHILLIRRNAFGLSTLPPQTEVWLLLEFWRRCWL